MQNKFLSFFCLVFFTSFSAFALDIIGDAPTLSGPSSASVNTELSKAFDEALQGLRDSIGNIKSKPELFIKSWGDSSVFASHGATQRAYGDYKTFFITIGPMIGLRLPGSPFTIVDDLSNLPDTLNTDQDIKLGLNPQALNINFGLNTSKFLLKNLYLGLHFGYMKLDNIIEGFSFNTLSLGATANYQFFAPITLAKGLFVWRGVNVGSGFIYQGTNINYGLVLDSIVKKFDGPAGSKGTLSVNPVLTLDLKVSTFVIPIEATTAVRLFWFLNIPLGVGFDLSFGQSDMHVGLDATIIPVLSGYTVEHSGSLSISAGGMMPPTVFNLKLMTGIGFNFGPVIIDIPITFYLDNGYSIGLSLGFKW